MLYSDDFLASLVLNPIAGALNVCEICERALSNGPEWTESDYQNLIEAVTLLSEMKNAGMLPIDIEFPVIHANVAMPLKCKILIDVLKAVQQLIAGQAGEIRLVSLKAKFQASLGSGFVYEFSQGDLERMQALINDLRGTIAANGSLVAEHKARLLKRLESLQAELHKKISDLDKFWGLIGDAGVVLGKLGNDAKPIVDRIRDIADIVWQTQSRAEELPSGTNIPQIGQGRAEDGTKD